MRLIPSTICIAIALATGACDRGRDTEGNLRKALDQAHMQTVQVDVDDDRKIVHLQGTVDSMADRTRAHEIAATVVGTSGRVLNDVTVEGLIDRKADDVDGRTTDAIDTILDTDRILRERDVNIEVINGMVIITGEVKTAAERNRVEQLVKAAPGVRGVTNDLLIGGHER